MKNMGVPRLATALLQHFLPPHDQEAVIGDLIERFKEDRSTWWFWRQTVGAIVATLFAEAMQHGALSPVLTAFGIFSFPIYMWVVPAKWFVALNHTWHPPLLASRWGWLVVNPWSYRLATGAIVGRVIFCVFMGVASWAATRLCPRQHVLVVTLLVGSQLVKAAGSVKMADLCLLSSPMFFFLRLWFFIFMLVAVPASVLLGARWGNTAHRQPS